MKSLNAVWLAMIFTIIGFSIQIRASEPDERLAVLEKLTKGNASPQVWWVKPRNEMWTDFEFVVVGGRYKADLMNLLKEAVFSEKAGDFFTLDAPFDYLDKKGQGILVVQSVDGGRRIGFRYRAINVNKNSLEFVEITEFNPKEKRLVYKLNVGLKGVVLSGDFRSILNEAASRKVRAIQDEK